MSCDQVEPGVTLVRANVGFVDGTPMGVLISTEVYIANSICFFACVFFTARDCVQTSILNARVRERVRERVRACVRACVFLLCMCAACVCILCPVQQMHSLLYLTPCYCLYLHLHRYHTTPTNAGNAAAERSRDATVSSQAFTLQKYHHHQLLLLLQNHPAASLASVCLVSGMLHAVAAAALHLPQLLQLLAEKMPHCTWSALLAGPPSPGNGRGGGSV